MESIANTSDIMLLDKLNFKIGQSASYITERTSVTTPCESGAAFSNETGAKMIRFKISGFDDWFDPETFVIKFTLQNGEAKPLYPLNADPAMFFKRWRLSVRNTLCEDINQYARVSQMFNILSDKDSTENNMAMGFGTTIASIVSPFPTYPDLAAPIPASSSRTVIFRPLSGFFGHAHFHEKQKQNYIPLRYCGSIDIEIELNDTNEPISISHGAAGTTLADVSAKWTILNPTCHYDVIKLDSALNENYTKHMSSGGAFHLPYCTFISSLSTILSPDAQVPISRSLSKLETVYISLYKKFTDVNRIKNGAHNLCVNFWSPNSGVGVLTTDSYNTTVYEEKLRKLQLSVGSKVYPVYPIDSHSGCLYELRKSMKNNFTDLHSTNINSATYRSSKFITAFNLCKDSDSDLNFAGYNTKNSTMVLQLTTGGTELDNKADMCHIVLVAEQILSLMDSSAKVSD
jgi:hypothetical protein